MSAPTTDEVRHLVPEPVRTTTSEVFERLAALRHGRVFHPRGVTLRAHLTVPDDGGVLGTDLLFPGRRLDAYVRLSRGIGTTPPAPDILGLAVKVPDAYGTAEDQDLLLASSADAPVLHHLLVPASDLARTTYSSILFYRVGPERLLLGARPVVTGVAPVPVTEQDAVVLAADHRLRFELCVADELGRWRPVAALEPYDVLPEPEGDALRFDAWNTGGGIRPVGPINRLRAAAYQGSRRGRHAA